MQKYSYCNILSAELQDAELRWHVGCFHGTSEELIAKAYQDYPEKGRCYEAAVNFMKARYAVNEDLPDYKSEEPIDAPRKCCKIKQEVYLE